MGSFLEKGDTVYWEKQVRGLFRLFDKVENFIKDQKVHPQNDPEIKSILKGIRHYRNIFREE
jgi:hypothetical protein